ncbi:Gp37 family protein, partial [Arsenophonus nasoniae]|uniref:Gp37 family protein n=1 Tax=Arsenophonus nasoniae TaxID=638 RepID=UPI003879A411
RPPDCQRDIWLVEEVFLGQTVGLWQYALTVETVTVFIQNDSPEDNPPLTHITREEQ